MFQGYYCAQKLLYTFKCTCVIYRNTIYRSPQYQSISKIHKYIYFIHKVVLGIFCSHKFESQFSHNSSLIMPGPSVNKAKVLELHRQEILHQGSHDDDQSDGDDEGYLAANDNQPFISTNGPPSYNPTEMYQGT